MPAVAATALAPPAPPPQKLLEYFPRLEDLTDKVLWGSDWPAPGVPGIAGINEEQVMRLATTGPGEAA